MNGSGLRQLLVFQILMSSIYLSLITILYRMLPGVRMLRFYISAALSVKWEGVNILIIIIIGTRATGVCKFMLA